MLDPTESVRRQLIADHVPGPREDLASRVSGPLLDTDEVRAQYEVLAFAAPFVIVRRKADGVKGSLQFQHSPRFYWGFQPAP